MSNATCAVYWYHISHGGGAVVIRPHKSCWEAELRGVAGSRRGFSIGGRGGPGVGEWTGISMGRDLVANGQISDCRRRISGGIRGISGLRGVVRFAVAERCHDDVHPRCQLPLFVELNSQQNTSSSNCGRFGPTCYLCLMTDFEIVQLALIRQVPTQVEDYHDTITTELLYWIALDMIN
jgi:hypothetical protein